MISSNVKDIERAIETLSPPEKEELFAWLDRVYPQPMDARLSSDISSGRLDAAIERALDDKKNDRTVGFLEVVSRSPAGNSLPRR